ncbi:30S ribosomal protein S17 [Candidatus Pacearchaeota archaeon CG10_big_fil_rev_8_21_14_0_10_31_9]|nr:MAG: 30S ribosomal protein S17 [Candidatus Pacearchaeota archaeon CG1_02_32_21]PIN93885.1 MAG: 30S ribosomal protein S17 [Candidatus Pacearchaeota archaeon CG10_big_fil_rev_8_21_14_0_10_31_9]PIZ83514.1 MAG: 30S ribosomal protein S17 [Candidatus Pacearchaeota archaeon CG_4_10_14_0_2_um_filter_05_32_18]
MEKKNKKTDLKVRNRVVGTRGRKFEGHVIRKFDKRVTIQLERVKYIRKYERYAKYQTKVHAYLPENMKEQIQIGDYIQVMETRPLSKIIHHLVVKKIRDADIKAQAIEKLKEQTKK